MTANPPIPAIANAITDAIGVRITELPITREDTAGIGREPGIRLINFDYI